MKNIAFHPMQQQSMVCRAKGVDYARALKTIKYKVKQRIHRRRFDGIEQAADVIICRNLKNTEQCLHVA
ncbi:MAG: hypothetical protein Q7U66_07420 [Methylobacter sp.]|nr:hypothetical protein [Methylobacter sp.]